MTHPYKHVLIAIANGEKIQWRGLGDNWKDQSTEATLIEIVERRFNPNDYRVKRRTINVNGFEIPEPVREPLEKDQPYFLVDCTTEEYVTHQFWDGLNCELICLERGLIHLDEGAAFLHSKALLSFTK